MITISILGNRGRLGNALFQYAAAKSLAIYHNVPLKLNPNIFNNIHDGQQCLLKYFKIPLNFLDNSDKITNRYEEIAYKSYPFEVKLEKFFNQPIGTEIIEGHFTQENWFKHCKDIIKTDLQLIDEINIIADNYLNNIRNMYLNNIQVIAIHIRRGDCAEKLTNSDPDNNELKKFIINAVNSFNDITNKCFVVFTGGSLSNNNTEDIEWCKNNLLPIINNNTPIIFSNNSSIVDFAILTKCDHIIITQMSSFVWWAAYLNNSENKKIISRKQFTFGEMNWPDYSNYILL